MKPIRFILLALIATLLLAACERPAPEGEIPAAPVEDNSNNTETVPRNDEADPAQPVDETPTDPNAPTDTNTPDTDTDTSTNDDTAEQPTEGETVTPAEDPAAETVEEDTVDQAPPLENGVYTVRAGDTLGQIAFIYGISVADIMAANNLTNPDVLDVGQQLVIPEEGAADTAGSVPADTTPADDPPADDTTGDEQVHVVQAGDNLYRIGLRYGFTVDELAEYNSLTDINNLEVGQEIRIPPQ